MADPFDRTSPGAKRLAAAHLRAQAGRVPTDIVLNEDVVDLEGRRMLRAGTRATVDAGLADGLVERGAAALVSD
jgi:hypothetical protein